MNNDLAKRAVACKGWRWMPGMLPVSDDPQDWVPRVGELYAESSNSLDGNDAKRFGYLPDLNDPATLGCVLALVRQAWGAPRMVAMPHQADDESDACWTIWVPHSHIFYGTTEAEALVAALEACNV